MADNETIDEPTDVPPNDTGAGEEPKGAEVNDDPPPSADDSGATEKKKNSFQERIDELTENWRGEERKTAMLQGQIEAMKQVQPTAQEKQESGLDPLDYNSDGEFIEAVVEKRLAEERQKRKATAEANKRADLQRKGAEKYEDFNTLTANGFYATPELNKVILSSDTPEDLVYHLAKNPAMLSSLNANPDSLAVAREIGKIEVKLTTKTTKKQTNAPPPVSKLPGGGDTAAVDEDKMSQKERFAKWEEDRLRGVG